MFCKYIFQCDPNECLAKKLGYYGDDGKIDKEVLTSHLEKKFENDQPILNAIKKNCLERDMPIEGPPICDLLKMNICIYFQFKQVSKLNFYEIYKKTRMINSQINSYNQNRSRDTSSYKNFKWFSKRKSNHFGNLYNITKEIRTAFHKILSIVYIKRKN